MKKSRINLYVLLGIFLCLFFCIAAGNGLVHDPLNRDGTVSYPQDKISTLSAVSNQTLTVDFQKGESLTEQSYSVKEGDFAYLYGLRQIIGLFLCLALTFLILRELKAGLFAFLRFCFVLPRYPGHIIEVLHRKDGKKKILLFSE